MIVLGFTENKLVVAPRSMVWNRVDELLYYPETLVFLLPSPQIWD